MLSKERHEAIIKRIDEVGFVKVNDLAVSFNVTKDCIRKDLTILQEHGYLIKTYGGAMKEREITHNFGVDNRKDRNTDEKAIIARKAMKTMHNGDVVFLDISTINIEIAKEIIQANMNITIVTNMIQLIQIVTEMNYPHFIFIGGILDESKDGFVGSSTIDQIQQFKFNQAFIGTVGIDYEHNKLYTYKINDGLTKKAIMQASKSVYVVLEDEKFYCDGTYVFGQLNNLTGIITNQCKSQLKELIYEQFQVKVF